MHVNEIIQDPIFNYARIAELLYGSKESMNCTKVSKKMNSVHSCKDWELKRLKEILTELKSKL